MTHTKLFLRSIAVGIALACAALMGVIGPVRADAKQPLFVEALIYTTMPSTSAHRPEMAMDGDPKTYFKSAYGMSGGDTFLVLLSQPIPVQSVAVLSGDSDGQDVLAGGEVETSEDGVQFSPAAAFDRSGEAKADISNKPVAAIRIRRNRGRGSGKLVLREITINSAAKISHFQMGPGRGFIDISQAPGLADWSRRAEQEMESFWADTAALLYSDQFVTPNMVNVVYRTGINVTPVAATGGGVMTVNSAWCRQHPEDTGLTVHETAHVIQAFSAYNPVWLVEGIADYIRWIKFEPQNYKPRINVRTATYHDSYRTTATFLAWCELHYDSRLVTKLNQNVRFGTYNNDRFKQYCGKDVDTLWMEFIAAYQADPQNIITPPIAPADRPRVLPAVKPDSSVPVDLAAAFNLLGIAGDGKSFNVNAGFDEGGAAYSAALLGTTQTVNGVQFKLGRPDAPNTVSCKGGTVTLPSGSYASLWLLGAGVEGNQMAQTFKVTYTDGTSEDLIQNLSDWFDPQNFPGEGRAVRMAYRNMANGEKDPRTFYVYSYGFPLNSAKTAKSLTLPNNANVKLLAITLAK